MSSASQTLLFAALLAVPLSIRAESAPPKLPGGWELTAQREEIRPELSFDPKGGPTGSGAMILTAGDSVAYQGWLRKSVPVTGGKFYLFTAKRKTTGVEAPRRSAIARIVWQNAGGKSVLADVPPGHEKETGPVPLAEPEHPLDGATDKQGWTEVTAIYRAPTKATQAILELHLQWAPKGRVEWADVGFTETAPPPSRPVRLATIHHIPLGKSMRQNCEEYVPMIAEAGKQKADLVVLGETVPYINLNKPPHETAEAIPGPTTDYFGGLAKKHSTHIVVSLYERDGKAVFNTGVLLGPDGKLIGKYRKVCLPHSEVEAGVAPGNEYPVFDTKIGKIGIMICYDGFFPEVARELTNRGAEVIAWPVAGCNPLLAKARACENHVYVVSNTYSDLKRDWMISAVYDHAGAPLAKAAKIDDVVLAEVDLSERYFWRNNLGDFRSMAQRHRPDVKTVVESKK
ncbi:carbon-nitrogen hydrolase family protein [Zavarzinella formosa]|uniref:carbon-nitrogen hydrolase family protein n=1 Tax=Zavarzinella formosa TaxID=360055 RepID=UPI000319D321|nr:carbon-nitrogen hydrolase family protein [Zavarzinella formosa]